MNRNRDISVSHLVIYSFLFLLLALLIFTLSVKAHVYVIKDKQGNVVRVTNQHQMLKKEKDSGFTITILIEDKKEQKQVSQFKKYNFKEKIDWVKVKATAQIIEQNLKNSTEQSFLYQFIRFWLLPILLMRGVVPLMLMVILLLVIQLVMVVLP
jgi:hypothetical protein